jgi:hypothetical protein
MRRRVFYGMKQNGPAVWWNGKSVGENTNKVQGFFAF